MNVLGLIHPLAAEAVLTIHVAIIAFNVFGLFAIPLGASCGWSFVHAPLWRLAHLASMAIVALQALAGRACFLTLWQQALTGTRQEGPLIMRWVNALVFWPLPAWAFTAAYLAIFLYVLALFFLVPPRWRK
ncbi:MAG TPA: DUF2784 domain-containing protein [Caulobacteraceae bacterium]|nr:DUF2784 domain-containing protein [Caulobacteraceae bacterium]